MSKATKYSDRYVPTNITLKVLRSSFTKKSVAYNLHNQNTSTSVNMHYEKVQEK